MMMENIVADQAVSLRRERHWPVDLIKRLTDLLIACSLIALTLPLMLIVALAIKCDSPGPVFYRQERVGLSGRRFALLKFRSMRQDAEADGRPVWAAALDDRITRVGGFMRGTRIDELPQLFNVLRGDMSLVGPRPIVSAEISRYGLRFASYALVRPGITGLWQVSGRNNTSYAERIRLDEFYVRNWSVWFDIYVLARTLKTVLTCEGAY
jgi:exopolysaccharide biosynthesis polyprenyl glycosylphosphotransferase